MVLGLLCVAGAAAAQTSEAYFQFLMAQRLEGLGDQAGALAALNRAAAADPAVGWSPGRDRVVPSAAQPAQRSRERGAPGAQLDDGSVEAHRVLGLIYWTDVDAMNARTPRAQFETSVRNAITHLERAAKDAVPGADLQVDFALGRLYLRTGEAAKAVDAFNRVVNQNSGSVQGRLSLAQAYAAAGDIPNAISALEVIVEDEPRVASSLAQYQEQAGQLKEAVESYTRALTVEPMSRGLKFRRIAALVQRRQRRPRGDAGRRGAGAASGGSALSASAGACDVRGRRQGGRGHDARADRAGQSAETSRRSSRSRISTTTPAAMSMPSARSARS